MCDLIPDWTGNVLEPACGNGNFLMEEDYLSWEEFENLPENESACRPTYDALPWRKAIIVYIETAEEP